MKLVILEDSSIVSFGGGQRVSLGIIESCFKQFIQPTIVVIDTLDTSYFSQLVTNMSATNQNLTKIIIPQKSTDVKKNISIKSTQAAFQRRLLPLLYELRFSLPLYFKHLRDFSSEAPIKILAATKLTSLIGLLFATINYKSVESVILYHHSFYYFSPASSFYLLILNILLKICKVRSINIFVSHSLYLSYKRSFPLATVRSNLSYSIIPNTCYMEMELKNIRHHKHKLYHKMDTPLNLCIFSSMLSWKGVIEAIIAFQEARLHNTGLFTLSLYGDGPLAQNVDDLCKLVPNTKYFGRADPVTILSKSHISIISSLSEESCPLSALESIASGTPAFSLPIGGQSEVLGFLNKKLKSNSSLKDIFKSLLFLTKDDILNMSYLSAEHYDKFYSGNLFHERLCSVIAS